MKRIATYLFAAVAIIAASCDDNIPATGSINSSLVEEVILDETLQEGITLEIGKSLSISEFVSALPVDATNFAQYYESSVPSIADVTELGILEAKAVGNCEITVYVGTYGICATFNVTVVKPADVFITSLRFNYATAEFDKDGSASIDMNTLLYVGSSSDTDSPTEKVIFSSSATDVATIDADGILTVKKLGETTITAQAETSTGEDSQPIKSTIDVKFYKMVEHERFPGDLQGTKRTIPESNWDAVPHSDGGWSLTEFGQIETPDISWANTGKRNSYRYAMLDGRTIVARGGDNNNLPTASNGTAFCWTRPGGNKNSLETDGVYFVIDMQQALIVNYFRVVNISDNPDDRAVFLTGVSEILGSNDASSWTRIAANVRNFNVRSTATHVDNATTIYPMQSDKAVFANNTAYRYIKFVMNKQDKCSGFYNTEGESDRGSVQIAELYMGYKKYTE